MSQLLTPILDYARTRETQLKTLWAHRPGVRIDLHCHSTFSHERLRRVPGLVYHPLQQPEELYDTAKARGMDFVTITDHNSIDGCKAFVDRRGDRPDFIFGEEASVTMPHDGTVVHVNVFDINEEQHREVQRLRSNLYDLADYLRRRHKLYVLNHMTWTAQHRVLTARTIEIMLEQFPVFEGINGSRTYAHNVFAWYATRGHHKALVGGSDTHTDRVGTTYTLSEGRTRQELLANIRAGVAAPCGEFGTTEQLREDVWRLMEKYVERRRAAASGRWQRAACRAVGRFGKTVFPLVCFGYDTRQRMMIRGFARVMAANEAEIAVA